MSLRLEKSSYTNYNCPHCNLEFDFDWTTEYGDAQVGSYSKNCPHCDKKLYIEVSINYSINKAE